MKKVNRILIIIAILLSCVQMAKGQEENIIAIAIYNFSRYVDWPADQSSQDFRIDIVGHKSVFEKMKEISTGRKVGNRNIAVRYLESIEKITDSEILFVGFWQSKELPKIADKIKSKHTLLITEKEGLIDDGSAINFVIRNNAIKFEIKKSNILKYGLILSETLEKMAVKTY